MTTTTKYLETIAREWFDGMRTTTEAFEIFAKNGAVFHPSSTFQRFNRD